MVMTITSLADAKARLSSLVTAAESTHERTTITKNGRPAAVLMSFDDLESLLATVELLSDVEGRADLVESSIASSHGLRYEEGEVWDGAHSFSDEDADRCVVARMGRESYDAARAQIRAALLAYPDANVRERARHYE